jgi:hypothetical protein
MATIRYFTEDKDRWGSEIRFRRPSNEQLKSDVPYLCFQGAVFGIGSVFGWRAFHEAPLVALLLLFGIPIVFMVFLVLRRRFNRLNMAGRR